MAAVQERKKTYKELNSTTGTRATTNQKEKSGKNISFLFSIFFFFQKTLL